MDACTVTASDVTAAFATFDPNQLLAKLVGFFGSKCQANRFAPAITQPISDWQRLIEANPFSRRYRPDIGYALVACSCERACNVDACTVSACYVIIAFAISGPSPPLAGPAGFFGSERSLNCFLERITQPTSESVAFDFNCLSAINACDRKSEILIVNTQQLCKEPNIFVPQDIHESRMNSGHRMSGSEGFPDIHSNFHNSGVLLGPCTVVLWTKFIS